MITSPSSPASLWRSSLSFSLNSTSSSSDNSCNSSNFQNKIEYFRYFQKKMKYLRYFVQHFNSSKKDQTLTFHLCELPDRNPLILVVVELLEDLVKVFLPVPIVKILPHRHKSHDSDRILSEQIENIISFFPHLAVNVNH